jgi:hypothetical protein
MRASQGRTTLYIEDKLLRQASFHIEDKLLCRRQAVETTLYIEGKL